MSDCSINNPLKSMAIAAIGAFGAIAGIIQSSKKSTADKCELVVNGQQIDNLYF